MGQILKELPSSYRQCMPSNTLTSARRSTPTAGNSDWQPLVQPPGVPDTIRRGAGIGRKDLPRRLLGGRGSLAGTRI